MQMGAEYAEGTEVPVERSRFEIERMLQRAGALKVGVMSEPGAATVYFHSKDGWDVQLRILLPTASDALKVKDRRGWVLGEAKRQEWLDQRAREKWRQLAFVLKAKLTSLDLGIETFEQVFLAHLVLGGRPVGERLLPAVRAAKQKGSELLLGAGS